ncbi:MAG: tRNA (adenosine(37)-N6)-threonylcarbamoyltransferase complex ATPase subunit type 1 TsaE [Candidatus Parcubacteria bacterium]|nr:tRNA (adenosine(37)-N6)-threonylcarbamoyltransferase complex ATPase subunit type 1 TsaE [Candidatus Parcubacteria bacterium]
MRIFISGNAEKTRKIAKDLAKRLLKPDLRKKAIIIGLTGELGAGKTVFTQGFARGLGIRGKIKSPTFILMRRHGKFYHFDAYRIKKPREIIDLGWKKIIDNPQNIILIEWAEKIKKILPKKYIKIKLEHVDKNKRKISFT